jgi:hypothetical protein
LIRQELRLDETYTEQNLTFNVHDILTGNEVFQAFQKLYQYFKIANIRLDFHPVRRDTDPPTGYIVFCGNSDLQLQYSQIPNLPYAKHVSSKHSTSYLFSRPGRQQDFNYWYDTNTYGENQTAYFRMRIDSRFENVTGYYIVLMSFDIRFDKPVIQQHNRIKEAEQVISVSKQDKKVIAKDEEELDKAFEEIPSEDDEQP